jgi:hypothetical protein
MLLYQDENFILVRRRRGEERRGGEGRGGV